MSVLSYVSFYIHSFLLILSEYINTLVSNAPNLELPIQLWANRPRKIVNNIQVEYDKNGYADDALIL